MSAAKKCDRCGVTYEVKKGVLALDVHVATGRKDGTWNGWSEVDFCPACSKIVLDAIDGAIQR